MRTRPCTAANVQPTSSTVSSMPGIERAAPERTDTRSGARRSPNCLPVAVSRNAMPSARPSRNFCLACGSPSTMAAQSYRQHEGRRHRHAERGHMRQIGGLGADGFGGRLLVRSVADTDDLHDCNSFSMSDRSASTCRAQQMAEAGQRSVARSTARASSSTDSAALEIVIAAQHHRGDRALGRVPLCSASISRPTAASASSASIL